MNTVNSKYKNSPLFIRYKRPNGINRNEMFKSNVTLFKKHHTFIDRVRFIIEQNIEDENYGINELMKDIGYSRSQLHNKIKKDSGVSTSIFIRNIRLTKAKRILKFTDLSISEVAYNVGFKDPSYFSRLFAEKYNVVPKKYRLITASDSKFK